MVTMLRNFVKFYNNVEKSKESTLATVIKNLIYVQANTMNISTKFQLHPFYGFWEEDFCIYLF